MPGRSDGTYIIWVQMKEVSGTPLLDYLSNHYKFYHCLEWEEKKHKIHTLKKYKK